MKVVGVIAKILTVLAAVVGAIYALATYGEQIVAWAKKIMESLPKCEITPEAEEAADETEDVVEEAVEEAAEDVAEAVEEVVEAAEEVIADDVDFEG